MSDETQQSTPEAGQMSHVGGSTTNWNAMAGNRYSDDVSLDVYNLMRRDSTVRAGLLFTVLAVASKIKGYKNTREPKIQEFVNDVVDGMRGSLYAVIREILSALWAGFSATEIVPMPISEGPWRGKWGVEKLFTMQPLSLVPDGLDQDQQGNLRAVIQDKGKTTQTVIERSRLIFYSHLGEFGNLWGNSSLYGAHLHWFCKRAIIKFWNIRLERFGNPVAVGYAPDEDWFCPIHNRDEPAMQVMGEMLDAITSKTSFVFPKNSSDQPTSLEYLGLPPASSNEHAPALQYHDSRILVSVLTPPLLLLESQFGTRAQADVQMDPYAWWIESLIDDVCSTCLIEQLVKPLILWNFGGADDVGEWESDPVTRDDVTRWSTALSQAAASGWLDPSLAGDDARGRELLRFPAREGQQRIFEPPATPGETPIP